MVTKGILIRLEAQPGKEHAVEQFLQSSLPAVEYQAGSGVWFAVRFEKSSYGIFDFYDEASGREIYTVRPVMEALQQHRDTLFTQGVIIEPLDVIASKLPEFYPHHADAKGLLLTFKAHTGNEAKVEQFLREAQLIAEDEPDTTAWFAIRTSTGTYGIFDVFPDHAGRLKHLVGKIPRELASHAFTLLGSVPDIDLLSVLVEKFEAPANVIV